MRKVKFANNEFYHIYNRGVDKRKIFNKAGDYERFLFGLFVFNNAKPATNAGYHSNYWSFNYWSLASIAEAPIEISKDESENERLVDIVSFCLMPNHFHLALKQKIDGGVSRFLHKLGTGHTNFFNLKYQRTGSLFQGSFKAVHVLDDRHLKHLVRYIHLNPLELVEPNWKKEGIKSWGKAKLFLDFYRWSSYCYYISKAKTTLLNMELISELFGDDLGRPHEEFVKGWTQKDEVTKAIIEAKLQ